MYASLIVGYLFVLFFLYVLGSGYYQPLLWVYRLLFRGGVGALVLYLFNCVGAVIWQLNIPVNPYNSLLVGYLGGPGMLFLILAKYLIKI